jgi:ABC-type branched-subunit amino acid transport system substrate-binding protein
VAVAVCLVGCGDQTSISDGGRVSGSTLTVYSLLPHTGPRANAARQIELGEKLALQQAHGRAGAFTVNFVARNLPSEQEAIAHATRDVVLDQGVIAVLGDLESRTARVTVPLLDAAGVLHVSPGVTGTGFANPSGRRTFASLLPGEEEKRAATLDLTGRERFYAGTDPARARGDVDDLLERHRRATIVLGPELFASDLPAAFADEPRVRFLTAVPEPPPEFVTAFRAAFPGEEPTELAALGWSGMREVLDAIAAAGDRARSRRAVIDAFRAPAATPPSVRG